MSIHTCCNTTVRSNNSPPAIPVQPRPGIAKRVVKAISKTVPGIMLVLMPKCPLCMAYYITLVTGAGVSFTTAKYLRITLLLVCISCFLYIAIMQLQKIYRQYASMHKQPRL